jgi:RNA polymerase-binding transcription factor DksA
MEVITMSANLNIHAIDNTVGSNGGIVWNRLHSEREDICEAMLKESQSSSEARPEAPRIAKEVNICDANWHRELLQARLRKIDDALDRLMAGSYGNCSKCGRWIEDTKLEFDPAMAFCIGCWQRLPTKH